mgnify:CR=1 FL=1
MSELPDTVTASDAVFVRAESPAEFAHWTSQDAARPVGVIVEPAGVPSDEVLTIAADVLADFDDVVATAREYIAEQLGAAASDPALFAAPEAVVWNDGTWMLRFADCGLDSASEYGVGVHFVGAAPQSVDLFDDAEHADHDA